MRGSRRPVARTNGSATALPARNSASPADARWMDIEPRGTFMLAPPGAHGRNLYRPNIVFGEPAATKPRGRFAMQDAASRIRGAERPGDPSFGPPQTGDVRRIANGNPKRTGPDSL